MSKRLEEIKENWAKGQGFDSFEIMRQNRGIDELDLDIIAKEYATECVKASLEKASEKLCEHLIDEEEVMVWVANKYCNSITNPDNIIML